MSLEKLLTRDFIHRTIPYLERVENNLKTQTMSHNKRLVVICEVLEKGISFGINKGGYVLKCSQNKVVVAKNESYKKWMKETVYSINEDIEKQMLKNKYKKKTLFL